MLPQTRKDFFELLARDRTTAARRKKSRVSAIGLGQRRTCLAVCLQCHAQVGANGDEARLKELCIPNREEALAVVHITTPQPEPFAGPESSPIQQEEQGTIRQWLQGEARGRQDDRRVQQA